MMALKQCGRKQLYRKLGYVPTIVAVDVLGPLHVYYAETKLVFYLKTVRTVVKRGGVAHGRIQHPSSITQHGITNSSNKIDDAEYRN
jgi:hypothetical protein